MEKRVGDKAVESVLEPILKAKDISLVECTSRPTKEAFQIRLIIHKESGVTIADCEEIHRFLLPRLAISLDRQDINLEVSSPGLNRIFKSSDEFAIFKNRDIKIYLETEKDWLDGKILETDDSSFVLKTKEGNKRIDYGAVHKARLEYTGG